MKAQKAAKKAIARKAKKLQAVGGRRTMKILGHKKSAVEKGVLDLFVNTYQALG